MSLPVPFYDRDGITIYCADNRDVLPHLGRFDLLLTDPPYGIGRVMQGGLNTGHWNTLAGGNEWDGEAPNLKLATSKAVTQIIWGGNHFLMPPSRCWLSWRKLNAVPTQSDFELAWTSLDRPCKEFAHASGGAMKRHGHPTEKPLDLMVWCLEMAKLLPGSSVLDPWAGSGTSLVAAKLRGYSAVGIEREEKYCRLAVERLRQGVLIAV